MKASFRDEIAEGRGRAWLRVRREGGRGLEREIDRACLRDRSFDAQVEGTRGAWLYEIAEFAGRVDVLRPRILRSLRMRRVQRGSYPDNWTLLQRLEFAAEDAARGSAEARGVVLAFAMRHRRHFSAHSDAAVLRAAGEEGLAAALRWKARDVATPGCWNGVPEFANLVETATEILGSQATSKVLRQVCAKCPTVDSARSAMLAASRVAAPPLSPGSLVLSRTLRRVREQSLSAERARRAILALPRGVLKDRPLYWSEAKLRAVLRGECWATRPNLREWGVTASARALAPIERWLMTERDPDVLCRLLLIFRYRRPTMAAGRVLALAARGRLAVRREALDALDPRQHPGARELAQRIIDRGPMSLVSSAIAVLARAPRPGDDAAILRRLRGPMDAFLRHWSGRELLDWSARHDPADSTRSLLWVWDHTPCSNCRDDALRLLTRATAVPARVRREACHDGSAAVRERARRTNRRARSRPSRSRAQ